MARARERANGFEELIRGGGRVRKRGCSSSSSSSSILQNVKLKRAILARKRGGSSTPVPSWKISASETAVAAASPYQASHVSAGGRGSAAVPVSARKLAATLWELQEMPSLAAKVVDAAAAEKRSKRTYKSSRNGDVAAPPPLNSHCLPVHLSDPSHSPSSLTTDRSGTGSIRRQIAMLTQKNGTCRRNSASVQHLRSPSHGSSMEIDTRERQFTPTSSLLGHRMRSGESNYNFATSTELLKILNRIWSLEEQRTSSMSLASALRAELEHARARIHELIQEQRADRHQIDHLMKKLTEHRTIWRSKEQDKLMAAIDSARSEIESERKLRRRMESLNKKLSRELEETKNQLSKALQDFERERKARELMEEVCDELAREIGQDKAKVEELKRESAKVWEEVAEERKMLQMAEVWREERVQMKLAEARLELEEKNATLDKLRKELEAFLRAKRATTDGKNDAPNQSCTSSKEGEALSESVVAAALNEAKALKSETLEMDEDDDSADSDLHSIELNKETLGDNTRAYRWSYASAKPRKSDRREEATEHQNNGGTGHLQDHHQLENDKYSRTHMLDKVAGEENEWDFTTSSQWIERSIEPCWQDHGKEDHVQMHQRVRLARSGSETDKLLFNPSQCDDVTERDDYNNNNNKPRRLRSSSGREEDDHYHHHHHLAGGGGGGGGSGSCSPTRQWNINHWQQQHHHQHADSARVPRSKALTDLANESAFKAKLMEARMEGHHSHHSGTALKSSFQYH